MARDGSNVNALCRGKARRDERLVEVAAQEWIRIDKRSQGEGVDHLVQPC